MKSSVFPHKNQQLICVLSFKKIILKCCSVTHCLSNTISWPDMHSEDKYQHICAVWCLSLIYDWLNSQYEINLIMSLDCIIESHLLLIIKKLITPFTLGVIHIPICSRCDGLLRNLCKSRILFCEELQHRICEILIFLCWYLVNTLQICAYRVQLFKTVLHFSFSKEFLCLGINLYCDRL